MRDYLGFVDEGDGSELLEEDLEDAIDGVVAEEYLELLHVDAHELDEGPFTEC